MKTHILAALSLALTTLPALAVDEYDRNVEAAAIRIVASKIGSIRSSFAIDQRPVFVQPIEKTMTSNTPRGVWRDGIALVSGGQPVRLSSF